MVKLIKHDLEFILEQIQIAEAHNALIAGLTPEDFAQGDPIGDALRTLVDSPLLPHGLRTVDGSYNNIVPGREQWGASGEPFPQLTTPNWVNENDDSIVFGAGSPGQVTFTDGNYGENGAPTDPYGLNNGTLVDADPRIISNLIVDQTLANPAVIAAALRLSGHAESAIPGMVTAIVAAKQALDDASDAAADLDLAALVPLQEAVDLAADEYAAAQLANASASQLAADAQAALEAGSVAVTQAQGARDTALANYVALLGDAVDNGSQATEIAEALATYQAAETNYQSAQSALTTLQATATTTATAAAEAAADEATALDALTVAQAELDQAQVALTEFSAAQDALDGLLATGGIEMDGPTVLLPNVAPDEGLSAPYNAWFTLFGQFFDHGLDLVAKGGNGTVYIPLQPDDPLYNPNSPHTNFMVMTRATIGEDAGNVTTPWVDQNQTYTSHASHQVFLREYVLNGEGKPVATGLLLEGSQPHTLATWGDIKAQAREMLGIELTDADVGMVPMLRTDPYGRFIPDPDTGFAQVIVGLGADGIPNTADDIVESGTPDAPINPTTVGAVRLPNAFLDDIAHAAVPGTTYDHDGSPMTPNVVVQADSDDVAGNEIGTDSRGNKVAYDNEMLDAHYITGDGRGNENIGLTAVHYVFHAEHNRQIEEIKATVLASGDPEFIASWQLPDGSWNGERLFQAARFATEMQYQHLVFEEFARKIQPDVDIFLVQPDVELNPAIFSEFANVVYRFGHSMLNQTVDRTFADGSTDNIDLFEAFLNPLQFGEVEGISQAEMAGAIAMGMSAQHANEIDEFVTDVLRNQLVGIPLDLAALNIARGRDTGMPTLNQAREQFMEMASGDTLLRPYTSWSDFAANLKTPESIINFIAAYGTHASVEGATTVEAKRDAAMELVFGVDVNGDGVVASDRLDFLNATGAYAGGTLGGLNNVDLWVGGLAEKKMAFGGMLGSTFSFVFQLQMENLQDSDRFYYLSRTQGLNFLTELENNSLAKMVMRNTVIAEEGLALPADIFSNPDHTFYVDAAKQAQMTGLEDPEHDNPILEAIAPLVQRGTNFFQYNGLDHIVIQGTDNNDHIVSGGGDDSVWGGAGNDRIEAGYGVDSINGGAGDDIITSAGTDIGAVSVLKGETGNDVIVDGTGMSLIFGGDGKDFISSGSDDGDILAGLDDDFVRGGDGINNIFGHAGNDWIEGGGGFDYIAGDNGELFFNSTVLGHDVLNGGQGDTDYDADSGDDIMFAGEGIQKNIGMWGHDWVIHQGQAQGVDADMRVDIFTTLPLEVLRDRFSNVEALSGWTGDDILRGDDRAGNDPEGGTVADPTPETGFQYNELNQAAIYRIDGLDALITDDLMTDGEYWADGSWENGQTGTSERVFVGGNILLGGGGSDTIEGRGGDDVIDGDKFLQVRVTGQSTDGIAFSVDSLEDTVTLGTVTKSLTMWMIEGRINPGTLEIVREIVDGGESGDTDTAVYWDLRENYEVTRGEDGRVTIAHIDQTTAVDPATGRNRESDGTDTLYNIELFQFADGTFTIDQLAPPPNSPATGAPVINDLTPTEGQTLTADVSSIADANGLGALNYQWQVSSDGGTSWANISALVGGQSASFTPNDGLLGFGGQVGDILRLQVSFTDGAGNVETLVSSPTGVVGDNWNATPFLGIDTTFDGTEGDDIANGGNTGFLNNANDTINGNGGNDILNGNGGNDTITGGAGNDAIDGGTGTDAAVYAGNVGNFALGTNGTNIVVTDLTGAEGVDTLANIETLRFAGANYSVVNGTANNNANVNGTNGANGSQAVFGLAGNDSLNGGAGNDLLVGGLGNDTANGGTGDDSIYWTAGDGRDTVDGGAGTDTMVVLGNAQAEHYRIYTRQAALAASITLAALTEIVITRQVGATEEVVAELDNIEEIVINGMGGGDTFTPIGDFTGTSLAYSTIHLEGGAEDDVVDITQLTSAHRVVFKSNGGDDVVVGTPREQDEIEASNHPGGNGQQNGHDDDDDHDDDHDNDHDDHHDDDDDTVVTPPPATTEPVVGSNEGEVLMGTNGADLIFGMAGTDYIVSGTKADIIRGDAGDDFVYAEEGRDIVFGGEGDDDVFGGGGEDMLYGDQGDDWLSGDAGNDMLDGGIGNDTVFGGAGSDMFIGRKNDGDDFYDGGDGVDTLDIGSLSESVTVDLGTGIGGRGSVTGAQSGTDTLYGIENVTTGSGNDTIIASTAVNVIDGGAGEDIFVFTSAAAANGDTIVGFETGDKIDLSGIDADTGTAGLQSFSLVSGQATAPGQIAIAHESREDGEFTIVTGNTGGDDEPEFRIEISGNHALSGSDFNL